MLPSRRLLSPTAPHAPILSTARALLALSRPRGAALLLTIPTIGYGFAHWDHAKNPERPLAFAVVLAAWLSLSAGTMWLNAALDGEEQGALYARPTARPEHLRRYGAAALAMAVAAAALADRGAGLSCGACALLSVLYSHPATAWKAHPVMGPLVNAAGYGALSSLAGWSVAGLPMDLRTAAAFACLSIFVLGASLAAQAFQERDDARRGYRTLVVTHGPAACLQAAHACMRASVAGVALFMIAGYYPRLCLLGVPSFWFAERWLLRWKREPGGGRPEDAAGLLSRMLFGASVLVALSMVDYLHDRAVSDVAAGQATAAGRPLAD